MPDALLAGLSRSAVEELSRHKAEPEWMLQKRLQAWDIYESMPTPLGRRGDLGTLRMFSNFKFQELNPYVSSNSNGILPALIEQSLQAALVDQRSGLLVQQYFMTTCVPVNSTKYTALHAAFWSGGVFLYIPKGVEIEDPILTQIWIDAPATATFAH